MDICLSPARAAASRRNGARSRGPKTCEGKTRSAQNALKHGMRAQKCIVLPGERAAAFEAFEAELMAELAPEGALQTVLAQRVVAASWRLARAERLEAELFAQNMLDGGGLGRALIRDGNGPRAFDTLLRYRGTTLAELWRALRTLKALQAESRECAEGRAEASAPRLLPEPQEMPIEPERRGNPGDPARPGDRADLGTADPCLPARLPHRPLPTAGEAACARPIGPERRAAAPASGMVEPAASLLAGTALVRPQVDLDQPGFRRPGARPACPTAPGSPAGPDDCPRAAASRRAASRPR
jgi:hypothetical protein